jgi:transcriptional regulator of arginine metabolism
MPIDREVQDQRRKAIVEILATQPARKQGDIAKALRKEGFKVTQSSISRDLKALGIVRVQGAYHLPSPKGDESHLGKMEEYVRRVRNAGPYLLVFETASGTAKAVSVALKAAAWAEIKGMIAEDDTIFVATDNVYDTRLLLQRMRRIMGK